MFSEERLIHIVRVLRAHALRNFYFSHTAFYPVLYSIGSTRYISVKQVFRHRLILYVWSVAKTIDVTL